MRYFSVSLLSCCIHCLLNGYHKTKKIGSLTITSKEIVALLLSELKINLFTLFKLLKFFPVHSYVQIQHFVSFDKNSFCLSYFLLNSVNFLFWICEAVKNKIRSLQWLSTCYLLDVFYGVILMHKNQSFYLYELKLTHNC